MKLVDNIPDKLYYILKESILKEINFKIKNGNGEWIPLKSSSTEVSMPDLTNVTDINDYAKKLFFSDKQYHNNEKCYILVDGTFLYPNHHEYINQIEGVDMHDFISMGNIRISPYQNLVDLDIQKEPSFEQIQSLYKVIGSSNIIELFVKDGDNEDFHQYRNPDPKRIVNQIQRFFNEGIKLSSCEVDDYNNTYYESKIYNPSYLHNFLLEYYERQLRLPFEEFGEGHAIIDEFLDWFKYSSKKGVLPKPTITWEEGLRKGCQGFVKKKRNSGKGDPTGKLLFDRLTATNTDKTDTWRPLMQDVEFDENGNLYVERSITLDSISGDINEKRKNLLQYLIREYEKNIGGCWSFKRGNAEAYCGHGNINIVLKGTMLLDDIFWPELIRLDIRRDVMSLGWNETEVRTYPNGRIQINEIVVNGKTYGADTFNGPRIVRSTYFGIGGTYNKFGVAELGYEKYGYPVHYMDREGNTYKKSQVHTAIEKQFNKWKKQGKNPIKQIYRYISDEMFDKNGIMKLTYGKKTNFLDKEGNILFPGNWFDGYVDFYNQPQTTGVIKGKRYKIDINGNIIPLNTK